MKKPKRIGSVILEISSNGLIGISGLTDERLIFPIEDYGAQMEYLDLSPAQLESLYAAVAKGKAVLAAIPKRPKV